MSTEHFRFLEKFAIGFAAMITIAVIIAVLGAFEIWLINNVGPMFAFVAMTVMVATFCGLMYASTPDKEKDE